MYFKVRTYVEDQAIQEQVVSLELANAKGYWLGDCNDEDCHGRFHSLFVLLSSNWDLYDQLQQYTRTAELVGINSFSLGLKSIKE